MLEMMPGVGELVGVRCACVSLPGQGSQGHGTGEVSGRLLGGGGLPASA